ncbi:ABC transporter ATP-binding protein [Vibrio fluvialis]|uniref:ABC transporter ATP-binding protein n=1 Tax=Vibrio fluvialis TaxID=676 RepID=UPI00192AC576|nr:ABC transporter ATP-binding protein [Vibrio fluvialis]MBL4287578.1 ABC transporter ATP-binding protein [Vibrio fluvialis]MBL4291603.1 ABC transporter ATP-binding protein [Vibrio fluvialis]MBY8044777.1 ABC transporter ATP-binding protein/permease [Vibrio fluvialis]MBY8053333.1 ABC transporter ATP-binding protein/permease [Vibrio fluvialis]
MLKLVKELFSLLTSSQKKKFYLLQILVLIMAIMEVVGIASIGPFMALVGDISLIEKSSFLTFLYTHLDSKSSYDFLFFLGLCVLVALGVASAVSMVTTWLISIFAFKIGTEISDRLYRYYLGQNWIFHSNGSSAQLIKQVSTESIRITSQVILPLIQMNARIVLAICIIFAIFAYNPIVALSGFLIFSLAYIVLYRTIKARLKKNGEDISNTSVHRFRLMNEGFGGIRDVLLLNKSRNFVKHFEECGVKFAEANGQNNALSLAPRYLMEFIAFGAMISLILTLIKTHDGNLSAILPLLAVYALAGLKLLPAVQQIYASLALIKGNIAAFEEIRSELVASQNSEKSGVNKRYIDSIARLDPRTEIVLKEIDFSYPNKKSRALSNLNMVFPVNKTIGIVGSSGSGKSTAIDILLGLLEANSGKLLVDNTAIGSDNIRAWQNVIGYVPQTIFLTEGTIAENIAFGLFDDEINYERIDYTLKLAKLDEFVSQLPKGVYTTVGERGVQLSGGQRQRIAIARALYQDASVLVFDEATSALDGITEKLIMDAINDFNGRKTIIIIAHRLKTVENCDIIYLMDNGKVIDSGKYQELVSRNESFREMAKHA